MSRSRAVAKVLVVTGLLALAVGCQTKSSAPFERSELPGGGIQIPHNERLHLSTDQKWIEKEGHLSDLIRLQWTGPRAKPALVWVDEQGHDKTAIISHDKANDPEQRDHKHLSIETTMSPDGEYAGQLFTRFEVPYDEDISEIRTHSANFNVMNGTLRVAGETQTNRELQLGVSGKANAVIPRWSIRADNRPELGNNEGSNMQLVRYDDDGQAIDAALSITRNDGFVGIGTVNPENKLDINDDRIRIQQAYTPTTSKDDCKEGQIAWDQQYFYVCVADNEWKRSTLTSW